MTSKVVLAFVLQRASASFDADFEQIAWLRRLATAADVAGLQ
jgi:hypothetical protein